MATTAGLTEVVLYDTLVNYLVSMARTVEGAMNRALDAIVSLESPSTTALPSEVFLLEPRINEMEIVIDEHAIRLLRRGSFTDDEMRLIVAALKITNDLERIGDLAVNLAERVVSLREIQGAEVPEELAPMASAVRAMVSKSLGALIFRNVEMATQVLESDDVVDQYRDRIFEQLLQHMTQEPTLVSPGLQFILALATSSASRTTPPTLPKTSFSGFAASMFATGEASQSARSRRNRPIPLRQGNPSSPRIHMSFIRT